MKKILAVLMVVALLIGCVAVLSACSQEKTHVGKWHKGMYYGDAKTGAYDVEIWATVHENGTCDIRWLEPADPEDSTHTFNYELVYAPEYVIEEGRDIYYDKENDRLYVNIDGVLFDFDRIK